MNYEDYVIDPSDAWTLMCPLCGSLMIKVEANVNFEELASCTCQDCGIEDKFDSFVVDVHP